MATLKQDTIATFQDFLGIVDQGQNGDISSLWFRGVGNDTYELKPSIHRHSDITDSDKLFAKEKKLLTRFRERSVPYLRNRIEDSWELLFLMQHYGMPTRLLDWTENPFISLFFALSSAKKDSSGAYINPISVDLQPGIRTYSVTPLM